MMDRHFSGMMVRRVKDLNPLFFDGCYWLDTGPGCVSAAVMYRWLLAKEKGWDSHVDWRWLWKLKCPEKIKLLLWLVFHNALPTNCLRYQRGLAMSAQCSRSGEEDEDVLHCLRDWSFSSAVWRSIGFGFAVGMNNL